MVSEPTVRVTATEAPVPVKCMADKIMQQVQKTSGRHPFNEIQVGDKKCSSREGVPAKEAAAVTEAELFQLELSEDDRREVMPVVDSLICGITDDLLCGGPVTSGLSFMESFLAGSRRQPTATPTPPTAWDSERSASKKGSKTVPVKGNSEGLIRAEYSQPPAAAHSATLAHMMAEKSSLKRELRSMDLEFEQREGRKPTKAEKEHLRPLYVRYWKLKHQIGKLQTMGSASVSVH